MARRSPFPSQLRPRGARPRRVVLWPLPLLAAVLACGDGAELAPPKPVPDRELYWSLELNHHAILMSTAEQYRTLRLEATPRNPFGAVLADVGTPTFTSPDHDRLLVSPTGELTAVSSTSGELIPVVATLMVDNVRHEDTAYVRIDDNPSPPVLTSFSIHPVFPDSAKVGAYDIYRFGYPLPIRALDANGDSIPGLVVYSRSSDTTVLGIYDIFESSPSRFIQGVRPGTALVYATTTAYGITKADTVSYRVGWPTAAKVNITLGPPAFDRAKVIIGIGGVVRWVFLGGQFDVSDQTDITFDDADLPNIAPAAVWAPVDIAARSYSALWGFSLSPSMYLDNFVCRSTADDCGSGNIVNVLADYNTPGPHRAVRVFLAPGTYNYRSVRYGISGQVVVLDEHE